MTEPDKARPGRPQPVQGRTLITVVLAALVAVVGAVFWAGMTGGSTHIPLSRPGVGFTADDAGSPASSHPSPPGPGDAFRDGGAIGRTVHDPRVREELRRRILAGWAAADEPTVAAAAKAGRFAAAPEGDGGARMEPSYIKEVIRSEFLPMAKHCYGELLARKKAAKGTMRMTFTIVADEKLGGIVEDASVEHDGDGGLGDDTMTTCMRESLSTLAFTPPEHGGTVTVRYPVTFAHDDDDGGPPGGPVTPRP